MLVKEVLWKASVMTLVRRLRQVNNGVVVVT
jgi:hypothetical protein